MPTCSYFLRGVCNRDDCPYLHVNVSKTAKVCQDFIKGFCHLGEKVSGKPVFMYTQVNTVLQQVFVISYFKNQLYF